MVSSALLALALLQAGADSARGVADAEQIATAYEDAESRELVRLARERRRMVDRSVERYRAVVQERISLGLRALRRERLFYRRETASRIDWTRDGPVRIDVLGAREVIPPVLARAKVPDDLDGYVPHLAFDPADNRMLIGWGDGNFVRHPLAPGSEADYRFRAGDTTVIALPDGRRVRLRELQIIPRRKDVHLVRGSFWLDAESHAVVQAGFRLADDFDLERDDDDDDTDDIPGILKPIRASVRYVTIEYGLWDLRWWLPRVIAFEGAASVGRLATAPLQYERVYSGYEVTGAASPPPPLPFEADSLRRAEQRERCRSRMTVNVNVGGGRARDRRTRRERMGTPDSVLVRDTTAAGRDTLVLRSGQAAGLQPDTAFDPCDRFVVTVPSDSAALMSSELLPPDPYTEGIALVPLDEIRELTDRLKQAAPVPWQLPAPSFDWALGGPGLVRYNRVEGLSIGARSELDLGRLLLTGTARIGLADLEPNAELTVARQTFGTRYELTGYRRLAGMDPFARPFSFAHSFSALVLGRDDEHYYRTLGGELRGRPAESASQWYEWRLFAQKERPAARETDFSIRHLLDDAHVFRDNAQAARATQYGLGLTLRADAGQDPLGFRWGAELGTEAAAGTFDYVRPALTLRANAPLPGRYVAALEVAGGTTFGHGAEQHLWRLGGPFTLRGYESSAVTGESFWRARGEIGTQFPGARIVVFSDVGRAGVTEDLFDVRPLLSAGAGASLLDGVIRLDLARALRAPTAWRLHLYVDGRM
jgi:hypothetical protein